MISITVTLICILFFLTLWHLVYETFISPVLKLKIRYKLFELRDKLIRLRVEKDNIDNDAFKIVMSSLNTTINLREHLRFYWLKSTQKAFENDQKFIKTINNRILKIEKADDRDMDKILTDLSYLVFGSMACNSGGWILYIFPIVVFKSVFNGIVYIISDIRRITKMSFKKGIGFINHTAYNMASNHVNFKELSMVREYEYEKLLRKNHAVLDSMVLQ